MTDHDALAALLHDEIRDKGWASCVHSPEGEWLPFCAEIAARLAAGVDAARQPAPDADGLDVERLARVLHDWMPDGADVSVGFDGDSARLTGSDLARYLFDRDREYAALAATPTPDPAAEARQQERDRIAAEVEALRSTRPLIVQARWNDAIAAVLRIVKGELEDPR